MMINLHYYGLSFDEAVNEADSLVARANETGYWADLPEALAQLRQLMRDHEPTKLNWLLRSRERYGKK